MLDSKRLQSSPVATPPRLVLACVLLAWLGATLIGMWYLNPIGPTGFSLCQSPAVAAK